MSADTDEVLVRVKRGVGFLTLNRPKAINSLNQTMVTAIDAAHIRGEDVPDLVLVEDAREARVAVGHVDLPAGMMTRDFHSKTDQD